MLTRAISAVVAVLLIIGLYFFFDTKGLFWCSFVIVLGCGWEYARLTLQDKLHSYFRWFFLLLSWSLLAVTIWSYPWALLVIAVYAVVMLSTTMLVIRATEDLSKVLNLQGIALMGILYCGLFPGLALRLLELPRGEKWFFTLLAIVFFGDTFAYLTGRFLGKNKIFPVVSPKKTLEGSAGGLLGSVIAATLSHWIWFNEVPLWQMIALAIVSGVFAQIGDFFESLIKRVAEVKDSGSIMPGHGGILDRLDGVLFAAPVFYLCVQLISNWIGAS